MGTHKQGPFGKMLEVCHLLHWTIDVPLLADRDGIWFEWLEMETSTLYSLACEAWSWRIWEETRHRKDLAGLEGIDRMAVKAAQRRVPAHHLKIINRLRDGTFTEPKQHATYNLGRQTTCKHCGAVDSIAHRCTLCPAKKHLHDRFPEGTTSLSEHCLDTL